MYISIISTEVIYLNMGERRENTPNRKQSDPYRAASGSQQRYQSRPYSSQSQFRGNSSRNGTSKTAVDHRSHPNAREQMPSARQSSRPRNSSMQRSERRSYPAERNAAVNVRPNVSKTNRSPAGLSGFVNTIAHYLRIANADILGRRRWKLLPAFYLSFACFYSEILLSLFSGCGLTGLIYKFFFSVSVGMALSGIALLFKQAIQKIVVRVELALIALLFIVECLIYREFQIYFPLGTILGNTTDVMKNYGGDLFHSIFAGIPVIVLFALPLVFYCMKTRKHLRRSFAVNFKRIFAVQLLAVTFVLWALGMLSLALGGDFDLYKTGFEITSSSDRLGLLTGFRLAQKYASGDNVADAFEGMDTMMASMSTQQPEPSAAPEESATPVETVVPVATEVPIGENSLGIDFAALNVGESNEDIQTINEYLSLLLPSKQNEYTGLFEGKNLIMICAEALSDAVIDPQLTPTLYRLTHNGFYFSQAYQPSWGGSTSTGEFSMLMGLVPASGDSMEDTVGKNNYYTMASQLKRIGYTTLSYHNGDYNYYDRNITHVNLGFDQFLAQGNGLEDIAGGYPSDEEMISFTLDTYIDRQPFCVYYMTCDGHKPYDKNTNSKVKEHLQDVLSVYPDRYQQNTLNYICYQLELEDALSALVAKLEAAGIADDTVICICADHYPYGLNRDGENYIPDLYGYEPQHAWERERNSIIIWSGCLENEYRDMACEISTPTYSLDILPTLSNLFGTEYDSRFFVGRDVFSDETPLVFWKGGSWVTEYGRYDAEEKVFYPTATIANEDEYVRVINNIVKYKKAYSELALKTDYFQYILDHTAPEPTAVPSASINATDAAEIPTSTPSPE